MTTYYETMTDAERALASILAEADTTLGDRPVAHAYDLEALGDEVIEVIEVIEVGPGRPNRYGLIADDGAFWAAVERHAR